MKTYEKYLITEKVTVTKMIKKIEQHLLKATTSAELQVASQMMFRFIKKHGDLWTDEMSQKMTDLFKKAKSKVEVKW